MTEQASNEANLDIVIFGATSFVGKIMAQYFLDEYGIDGRHPNKDCESLRWGIAARSESKLKALKSSLEIPEGLDISVLPTVIADSNDEQSLRSLCASTKVVLTTVGPYAFYGELLVKVCAETGTDYCDLTGEVPWMRRMIEKYEAVAKASGARIVHNCGFDSIPSDLGVYYLQSQAKETFNQTCNQVHMRVKAAKGGVSGGTVASLMNVLKELEENPALQSVLEDPYSVCGDHPFSVPQEEFMSARFDNDFDAMVGHFVMSAINTRVVHRSNLLTGCDYGKDFIYDEGMLTGKGFLATVSAHVVTGFTKGFSWIAGFKGPRKFLENYVVPKPGEGPSPKAQLEGFYDLRFVGKTKAGDTITTKVTGDRDPGYGSTAKMLAQAGMCLAFDIDKQAIGGGFWTPSTAMGDALVTRLRSHAGLTFSVTSGESQTASAKAAA